MALDAQNRWTSCSATVHIDVYISKIVSLALQKSQGARCRSGASGVPTVCGQKNTVMYYSPTILQLAGIASNQTALLLSLVTAGLNVLGTSINIYFIDRTWRKKLLVMLPGACLISNSMVKDVCRGEGGDWYTRGCPSSFGWLALLGLALYILFFSPGMGPVPWIMNSEIYPLQYCGICGGIAATTN
ncbi:hypothetical protein ACS0TY_031657 [Phlomoides rotata]